MKNLKNFSKFKDKDTYSLAMFILYKLTNIPEYSINGELPYILDKKNLLNFCNYFGGRTIRVPTLTELYSIMNLILLYQYVKIDGMEYNEAISTIGYASSELKKVKAAFNALCKVLDKYDFKRN
jgi:hypothetical protein